MAIIEFLKASLLGKCLLTFFTAMVPVIELRGAIPMGVTLGLNGITSALISIAGNILPVPFIITFVRRVFAWMRRKSPRLAGLADRFERKARARGENLYRSELIGLFVFVAIPLPGTGAWTGALIAALLNLRLRAALPAIGAGVVVAGVLVTGITFGFKSLLFG